MKKSLKSLHCGIHCNLIYEKASLLIQGLECASSIHYFLLSNEEDITSTQASYVIAWNIFRVEGPYSDGDFI